MKQKVFDCLLLIFSLMFYVFAQPNFLFKNGCFIFAYFVFFPLTIFIHKNSIKNNFLYGFIFGILMLISICPWFYNFALWALIGVAFLEGGLFGILFVILSYFDKKIRKNKELLEWFTFTGFEFVRTKIFLGFENTILAYSQWTFPLILQCADLFGVWGISLLITFPSFVVGNFFLKANNKKKLFEQLICWFIVFLLSVTYGLVRLNLKENIIDTKSILLVQTNTNQRSFKVYNDLRKIDLYKGLIDKALEEKTVDLIVLPEGAVTRDLQKDQMFYFDSEEYDAAMKYKQLLTSYDIPVIYGGQEIEVNNNKWTIYNDSWLLENKKGNIEFRKYRKRHLVPIGETLPFKNIFPKLYSLLRKNYCSNFSKGNSYELFNIDNMRICTPLCFEDMFGSDIRQMCKMNPNLIVSLCDDSWSKSNLCMQQHLMMSVFRTVENRLPFVRSSITGKTVYINNKGKVINSLDTFKSDYLIADVNFYQSQKTLYLLLGDLFGYITLPLILLFLVLNRYEKKHKRNRK